MLPPKGVPQAGSAVVTTAEREAAFLGFAAPEQFAPSPRPPRAGAARSHALDGGPSPSRRRAPSHASYLAAGTVTNLAPEAPRTRTRWGDPRDALNAATASSAE